MTEEKQHSDSNIVYIGEKPLINYATSIVMQFTTKNSQTVLVKARGKHISKAVDVSEIAIRRFLQDQAQLQNVRIGSEEFENKEGRKVFVSFIEITLEKKQS